MVELWRISWHSEGGVNGGGANSDVNGRTCSLKNLAVAPLATETEMEERRMEARRIWAGRLVTTAMEDNGNDNGDESGDAHIDGGRR